jgi:hypothetical protein
MGRRRSRGEVHGVPNPAHIHTSGEPPASADVVVIGGGIGFGRSGKAPQ